jgi:hypothetical protein
VESSKFSRYDVGDPSMRAIVCCNFPSITNRLWFNLCIYRNTEVQSKNWSISDSPAEAIRGGYCDEPNWREQRKNKLQAKNLTQPGCNQSEQAGGESKDIISELSFRGRLYRFWNSTREKRNTPATTLWSIW